MPQDGSDLPRSPPRSSPADVQQAVLQCFVRPQLGALAAKNGAAAIEHHGIFGEGQGEAGFCSAGTIVTPLSSRIAANAANSVSTTIGARPSSGSSSSSTFGPPTSSLPDPAASEYGDGDGIALNGTADISGGLWMRVAPSHLGLLSQIYRP
jgi:hypothetical protein